MELTETILRLEYESGKWRCWTDPNVRFAPDPDHKKNQMLHVSAYPRRCQFIPFYEEGGKVNYWVGETDAGAMKLAGYYFCEVTESARKKIAALTTIQAKSRMVDHYNLPIPEPANGYYPYGYQMAAIAFMDDCFKRDTGCLIADDAGLGKTPVPLCYASWKKEIERVLIICPSNVRLNWVNEIFTWLNTGDPRWCKESLFTVSGFVVDPLKVQILKGKDQLRKNANIAVVSWDGLRSPLILNQIHLEDWDMIVGDESHYIKHKSSARAKAAHKLQSKRRVLMSATPADKPFEYFSQLHWLDPKTFDDPVFFKRKYNKNPILLGADLRSTLMIQRKKSEVTDLPAKFFQMRFVDIPTYKKEEYEDKYGRLLKMEALSMQRDFEILLSETQKSIRKEKDPEKKARLIKDFELIFRTKMEQFIKEPYIKDMHISHEFKYLGECKIESSIEIIQTRLKEVKKIVVGFVHPVVGKKIYEAFKDISVYADGSVDTTIRDKRAKQFNTDPQIRLFVGSILACGEGINLHHDCSHMIYVENYWTGSKMTQFENRIHRSGQNQKCTYEYVVARNTMDHNITKYHAQSSIIMNIIFG